MERSRLTYLLDTASWINGVTMPEVLPARIRRLIDGGTSVGLCTVSLLETAILYRLARFEVEGSLEEFFAAGLSEDVELLELTPIVAARTNDLPESFQGDPFDRTITATAAVLGLTLITADAALRDAGVCAVEYYSFKPSRRGDTR
jgi:PIN domain nuclease of toxin-antitoxin system